MAEIAHFFDFTDTQQNTVSASYETTRTIAASNFVAGGKYLIGWRGTHGGSGTNLLTDAVLSWATTGDLLQTESGHELNATGTSTGAPWNGFTVIIAPTPVEDLLVKLLTSAQTAHIEHWQLHGMRLDADLVENTDFYIDVDDDLASPVGLTTTLSDFATSTHNFAAGNWLFLSMVKAEVTSTAQKHRFYFDASGGGIVTEADQQFLSSEGEDNTDTWVYAGPPRVYNLDGSSFTYKIRGDATANADEHAYSEIIAVNLDKFAEFKYDFDASQIIVGGEDAWFEILGLAPFTPAVGGQNWAVMGYSSANVQIGGSREQQQRVQVGGVSIPTSGVENSRIHGNDVTDEFPMLNLSNENFAASSQDIDLDGFPDNTNHDDYTMRAILAWSMELAAAPAGGRIMSSLVSAGGLVNLGGLAGQGGGLAG